MRTKYKLLIICGLILLPMFLQEDKSAAEDNPIIGNKSRSPYEYTNGSNYWTTTAIREWLNSDSENTKYTNADASKVGYESKGFLAGFSKDERDGIAVTERRSFVSSSYGSIAKDGGTLNVPRYDGLVPTDLIHIAITDIEKVWQNLNYQTINEKVFILSPNEMYEYVQKRGKTFKKTRANSSQGEGYWTSTYARSDVNTESMWAMDLDGKIRNHSNASTLGVVPAIHLKPNHQLKDGKNAKDLKVNESVEYGSYKGSPISWEVINVTEDGYALLWSKDILDKKRFSVPTETIYRDSNVIDFKKYDVSIKDELKYNNGNADTTEPYLKLTNEDVIMSRQNGGITLKVQAFDNDGGSGVSHIILPNGEKVDGDEAQYDVQDNGRYEFKAVDKAGNYYGFQIPVGNINPPAHVVVNPSTEEWTNNDVTVDIITNEANTEWIKEHFKGSSTSGPAFPEFTTYAGKTIRMEGKVRRVRNDTRKNYNVMARLSYDVVGKAGNNYKVATKYVTAYKYNINNLSKKEYTPFELEYEVSNSYFGNLRPNIRVYLKGIDVGKAEAEWKDVKFTLLDRNDFKINKITLPNGKEIQSNSYTDTLTKSGKYTYKVLDNRGKVTSKSVSVKIDKVKPTIKVSKNGGEFARNHSTRVTASDSGGSGLKSIEYAWSTSKSLPSKGEFNEIATSGNTIYTPMETGQQYLHVRATDNAGNVQTFTSNAFNVDVTKPDLNLSYKPTEWTNQSVTIKAIAEDNYSGVESLSLKQNENLRWVNLLSMTDFYQWDGSNYNVTGNKIRFSENATNYRGGIYFDGTKVESGENYVLSFDMTKLAGEIPYIGGHLNVSEDVEISIDGKKPEAIEDRNAIPAMNDWHKGVYYPNDKKTHHITLKFKVDDNRNTSNQKIYIQINRMMYDEENKYEVEFSNIQLEKGTKETTYEPSATDAIKGNNPLELTVYSNGDYAFVAVDKVGNVTEKTLTINNIDTDAPTLDITPNTTDKTHEDVVLTVKGTDKGSGVKRIKLPNNKWINAKSTTYNTKENGTYTFIVEDNAGNQTEKSYKVNNIDKTISFGKPNIDDFEDITIKEEIESLATNIKPIEVSDWRDGSNEWRLGSEEHTS